MREKDNRIVSYVIIAMAVLLILSLISNIHLIISSSNSSKGSDNLTRSHMNRLLGDMDVLAASLDLNKTEDWSDAYHLFGTQSHINTVKMRAQSILWISESGVAHSELSKNIIDSGLEALINDLDGAYGDFGKAAHDRANNRPTDFKKLELLRAKIERARFPDQKTFTWGKLRSSLDRYFDNH